MATRGRLGGAKTGGRVKGTPNRLHASIKEMVEQALQAVGGAEYLARQAEEQPVAFLSLLGKIMPIQVAAQVQHSGSVATGLVAPDQYQTAEQWEAAQLAAPTDPVIIEGQAIERRDD